MQNAEPTIVAVPRSEAEVWSRVFPDHGDIPNNPDLPALCLRGVLTRDAGAEAIRALLGANEWVGMWQWTVFDYHHYHPNAHEVLVVSSGSAELALGGPAGEALRVSAGDVLILPAGTGHCRLAAAPDFQVCGAYPSGQEDYETLRVGDVRPPDVTGRIAGVPRPDRDPVYGAEGPLRELWLA